MKTLVVVTLAALFFIASAFSQSSGRGGNPPAARRGDFVETLHGVSVPDPYRWLEEQWSTETRAWIDGQMAHSRPLLMNLPSFSRVEKRMRELFNIEQVSG